MVEGFYGKLLHGLSELEGESFLIGHDDENILLGHQNGLFGLKTKDIYGMPLNAVVDLNIYTEEEIIEKGKSVLTRGILGGLVFGEIGAIIGAISGIGTKKIKKDKYYAVLDLDDDGQVQTLVFELDGKINALNAQLFKKLLDKKLSTLV